MINTEIEKKNHAAVLISVKTVGTLFATCRMNHTKYKLKDFAKANKMAACLPA